MAFAPENNDANPWATPAALDEEPIVAVHLTQHDFHPSYAWAFFRWLVVCGLSAAPSFMWGLSLHSRVEAIAGMLSGVLLFVLIYTLAECSTFYQRLRKRNHVAASLKIGYITRIALSILFPIGMFIDMFVGMFATGISQSLFGYNAELLRDMQPGSPLIPSQDFLRVFLTTVIQGALLNILLFLYMLIVYTLRVAIYGNRPYDIPQEQNQRVELLEPRS
jgi:hypothetical protein